ncbi:hypothetical protein HBI51_234250 [Parastagonospora nodorum]|nr:hypothetical protein HBI51_234250 [Parastagonospora nodorum]
MCTKSDYTAESTDLRGANSNDAHIEYKSAHMPPGVVVICGVEVNDNTEDVRSPNQGITESQFCIYVLRSLKVAILTRATVKSHSTIYTGQVHIFTIPGCLDYRDLPAPISTIQNVTIGQCYNAADTEILASVFASIRAWTLGTLPAEVSCETKAYFDTDCGDAASVTDNRQMGKCFNTVDNPAVTKGSVGQSFRIECCEGDGKGSCVFD